MVSIGGGMVAGWCSSERLNLSKPYIELDAELVPPAGVIEGERSSRFCHKCLMEVGAERGRYEGGKTLTFANIREGIQRAWHKEREAKVSKSKRQNAGISMVLPLQNMAKHGKN